MAFTAPAYRRPALVLGLVLAGAGAVAGPVTAAHAAANDPDTPNKVTICHTGDGDNLVEITPSASGVLNGHEGHDDDVIPPFTANGVTFEGRNWTELGQATYENGCVAPAPTDTGDDPGDDPTEDPGDQPEDPGDQPADPGDQPAEADDSDSGASPTATPTSAVLAEDDPTDPENAPVVSAVLAETGSDVTSLVLLATGVIAAGAAAVAATHRRARRSSR